MAVRGNPRTLLRGRALGMLLQNFCKIFMVAVTPVQICQDDLQQLQGHYSPYMSLSGKSQASDS